MAAPPALADVLELNVGGQVYYTRRATLAESASPLLARLFSSSSSNDLARDPRGRYFIDRDGFLFRYVLDFLRDQQVVLPDRFPERRRLRREAEFYQLPALATLLSDEREHEREHEEGGSQGSDPSPIPPILLLRDRRSGFLTVACRASCARSRRAPPRLAVSGRVALAREVFAEALDEGREPQQSPERYTARLHLRFPHLERAFDLLAERGFRLVGCNSASTAPRLPAREEQEELEEEEEEEREEREERSRWSSYTEYIFYRK